MILVDTKKLGRVNAIGLHDRLYVPGMHAKDVHSRDSLHAAVDDASRLAYTEILSNKGKVEITGFLLRAPSWFGRFGTVVESVMTDDGSACRSKLFASALESAGVSISEHAPNAPPQE